MGPKPFVGPAVSEEEILFIRIWKFRKAAGQTYHDLLDTPSPSTHDPSIETNPKRWHSTPQPSDELDHWQQRPARREATLKSSPAPFLRSITALPRPSSRSVSLRLFPRGGAAGGMVRTRA